MNLTCFYQSRLSYRTATRATASLSAACTSLPTSLYSHLSKKSLHKPASHIFGAKANVFSQIARTFASMGTELAPADPPPGKELATFAGGCFWGLELAFQRIPGVVKTSVGYTHGNKPNPTYLEVSSGRTRHAEAVQVTFDPSDTGYKTLVDVFFERTDPTTLDRQGNDFGVQYRSGIYYHSDEQKTVAEKAIEDVQSKIDAGEFRPTDGEKVVVELLPAGDYYFAEDFHQQYLEKGGRFNRPQSAEKGCQDPIRCYG